MAPANRVVGAAAADVTLREVAPSVARQRCPSVAVLVDHAGTFGALTLERLTAILAEFGADEP